MKIIILLFALITPIFAGDKIPRVTIDKVEKAIEKDPKDALEKYGDKDFKSKFGIENYHVTHKGTTGNVDHVKARNVFSSKQFAEAQKGKKLLFRCKIEKYDGTEKIRIRIFEELKR